jgi:hypothetical protein
MTEPGADDSRDDAELDDPGRDPKGLDPPRNLFGGGPTQTTGRAGPDEGEREDDEQQDREREDEDATED